MKIVYTQEQQVHFKINKYLKILNFLTILLYLTNNHTIYYNTYIIYFTVHIGVIQHNNLC